MIRITTILLSLLVLLGCSHSRTITMARYHEIEIGDTVMIVQEKVGKPYEVREISDQDTEYLYIERIEIGPDIYQQREYSLTFRNGEVTNKQFQEQRQHWDFMTPPAR